MKKNIILITLLLLYVSPLAAIRWYYLEVDCSPFIHKLAGNYTFEGDRHKKFAGDIVAVLDDTSAWKVHPTRAEQFQRWKEGEKISISLRTSYFLFKREHHFLLVNLDRHEEIPAMMISSPLTISLREDPVPLNTYIPYTTFDCEFRANLILNNDKKWEVSFNSDQIFDYMKDKNFHTNTPCYIGFVNDQGRIFFFLINGDEREAVWRWARMGNYYYGN